MFEDMEIAIGMRLLPILYWLCPWLRPPMPCPRCGLMYCYKTPGLCERLCEQDDLLGPWRDTLDAL